MTETSPDTARLEELASVLEQMREAVCDLGHAAIDRGCQSCGMAQTTITNAVEIAETLLAELRAAKEARRLAINEAEAFRGSCATAAGRLMVVEGLLEDIRAASQAYPSSRCALKIKDVLGRHKPWASIQARSRLSSRSQAGVSDV